MNEEAKKEEEEADEPPRKRPRTRYELSLSFSRHVLLYLVIEVLL